MLQWIPGTEDQVIWNDREGEGEEARLVARILDVGSREERTIDAPIYTLTPDGRSALSIDFLRLQRARPTYGYVGVADHDRGVLAPDDNGIFLVDLATGERELLFSLAEIVVFGRRAGYVPTVEHYVEMLRINPSGTRFVFYERWLVGTLRTRVFTADLDGSDLHMLTNASNSLSHVAWRDDTHLVIYAPGHDGYALFEDRVGYVETLLESSRDGHHSFLADGEWMLSDTYGDDARVQHPFLYHLPTETVFSVAHLLAEPGFEGVFRCDNHPRTSRDGRKIVIDSAHRGGRQMYLVDIGEILDAYSIGVASSDRQ